MKEPHISFTSATGRYEWSAFWGRSSWFLPDRKPIVPQSTMTVYYTKTNLLATSSTTAEVRVMLYMKSVR
jgi:hypothetical protein